MINVLFSRMCILTLGTLYPGYVSFKAVRAKNVEEYVKWMMYWIVFAIFTAAETFTDIFLTWFPFYYELKVLLILWLVPTMGNGSSFLYKKCVHPLLKKHETRVDHHLEQVREKGQDLIVHYISEAALYVGRSVMNIVNKNFPNGVMGTTMANNVVNGRRLPAGAAVAPIIMIEEEDEDMPLIVKKATTRKNAAKHLENAESTSTRGRARKSRQTKTEVDHNLNESQ